jgi:hypothetical protein
MVKQLVPQADCSQLPRRTIARRNSHLEGPCMFSFVEYFSSCPTVLGVCRLKVRYTVLCFGDAAIYCLSSLKCLLQSLLQLITVNQCCSHCTSGWLLCSVTVCLSQVMVNIIFSNIESADYNVVDFSQTPQYWSYVAALVTSLRGMLRRCYATDDSNTGLGSEFQRALSKNQVLSMQCPLTSPFTPLNCAN